MTGVNGKGGTLLLFGISRLDEMLAKGNVWYVRHYEAYFQRVYVVYLTGLSSRAITDGTTTLVSLGRRNTFLSLLFAPISLYIFAKRVRPTHYLTADVVFSWWTACLLRILFRARMILMPVCMPELIYNSSGKSLSGMPIALERLFTVWSFRCAATVLTGHGFGGFVNWLSSHPLSKRKLVVVDTVVDSLPTEGFLNRLDQVNAGGHKIGAAHETVFEIVYVGRLHREKLVGDLIKMMAVIAKSSGVCREIMLTLIGDGPEKSFLEKLASQLEVQGAVKFIGIVPNQQLPDYLCKAKAFVSPLTGTSLREAALCGLPIVAYNMDWVEGLFKHEETALLVSPGDYEGLARQVVRLSTDEKLCKQLSANVKDLAWRLWSPRGLKESLSAAFAED